MRSRIPSNVKKFTLSICISFCFADVSYCKTARVMVDALQWMPKALASFKHFSASCRSCILGSAIFEQCFQLLVIQISKLAFVPPSNPHQALGAAASAARCTSPWDTPFWTCSDLGLDLDDGGDDDGRMGEARKQKKRRPLGPLMIGPFYYQNSVSRLSTFARTRFEVESV